MRTHRFDLSLTPNLKPNVSVSLKPNLVLTVACLLAVVLFLLDAAVPEAHFWSRCLLPIIIVFLWGPAPQYLRRHRPRRRAGRRRLLV